MSETQKFTDEEVQQVRSLQSRYSEVVAQMGYARVERLKTKARLDEIEKRELDLETAYKELNSQELQLIDSLQNKYGEGVLDIQSGTFTPTGNRVANGTSPTP